MPPPGCPAHHSGKTQTIPAPQTPIAQTVPTDRPPWDGQDEPFPAACEVEAYLHRHFAVVLVQTLDVIPYMTPPTPRPGSPGS